MSSKGRRLVTVLSGLLAVAGLVAAIQLHRGRTSAEVARVDELLTAADEVVARATEENLIRLAAEEFAQVGLDIGSARSELAAGRLATALTGAEAALSGANAARDLASQRLPVQRAAVLSNVKNKVLHRSAEAVAWSDAQPQMNLFDRDRIATKARAEAIVRFHHGNEMRLEENSVLVVETLAESRTDPTISMTLAVPEGSVRSVVARADDRDVRLKINLPRANIVVDTSRLAGGRADIATRVHPDASNRIAVYTGEAEVVAPNGDSLVVASNQYTEVQADGTLSAARELPTAAITLLPGRDATVFISAQRPEVTFKWQRVDTCVAYRLEVARDADFFDKTLSERVTRDRFTYGNLEPGKYLWRMSCLDDKGTQGQYSEITRFAVVMDNDAPALRILSPNDNAVVNGAVLEARCKTEPGVSVFINGEEAAGKPAPEFVRVVELQLGVNTVVFEAIDEAGNVMYNSRLVTRMQ